MSDLNDVKWICTKDRLPDERKYVLGRYAGGNWSDPDDNENVNVVVVKLLKGITLEERDLIAKGLCDTNHEENRHNIFFASDEQGNNKLPYEWRTFGPSSFFGQDITYWMPIIKLEHDE